MALLALSELIIGEPDANAEYYAAKRLGRRPVFLQCFYQTQNFPTATFHNGEKYFLYGQKGTEKTAVLRSLEHEARENHTGIKTEFLVFKKAIIEETDLQTFGGDRPVMLDEDEIKRTKHHHHALKRLMILILLSKILHHPDQIEEDELPDETQRSLLTKIKFICS